VALTKVQPTIIAVANNVTNKTVGNTTSIPSFTFDGSGVITSASNNTVSVANTRITGNIISSQIAPDVSLYGTTSLGKESADYVNVLGGSGTARVEAVGTNTDINLSLATKGTGSTYFWRGGYGGTQMALLNQYGLGLGATTPSSGMGITFPASQIASSNANTLDDYEEGTWTPIDASGAGLTLSVVSGAGSSGYVKIGQMVYAVCSIQYPSNSNGAGATIGGLPYASIAGANGGYWGGITRYTTNSVVVMAAVAPENTVFNLYIGSGTGVSNSYVSNLRYDFIFMYRTAN